MDLANTHNSTPEPVDSRDRLVAQFGTEVMQQLPYEPNQEQLTLVAAMAHFLFYGGERAVFVLNGYAGTGKTSMVGGIVKALSLRGMKTASILNNVVLYGEDTADSIGDYVGGESATAKGERLEILTALEAFYLLETRGGK